MNDAAQITTYILKRGYKYYCGKTANLEHRMKEHAKDRWQHYELVYTFEDDFEKQIKRAGVESIVNLLRAAS